MKKFFSKYKADQFDPEAVNDFLKELKIKIMRIKDPAVRGLMCFLSITGARVNEVLPNEKYKTVLTLDHISPSREGIIRLPLTEKKRVNPNSKSLKYKGIGRFGIIWDKELWAVFLDYVINYRPTWKSNLLRKSWFNPKRYISFMVDVLIEKKDNKLIKYKSKFYQRYAWLFRKENQKENLTEKEIFTKLIKSSQLSFYEESKNWLVRKVIFPFTYKSLYNFHLSKITMKAKLIDLQKGEFVDGERCLYSHVGREYFVNYWIRNLDVSDYEITRVLNWADSRNMAYYLRQDVSLITKIARKVSISEAITQKEKELAHKYNLEATKIIKKYID